MKTPKTLASRTRLLDGFYRFSSVFLRFFPKKKPLLKGFLGILVLLFLEFLKQIQARRPVGDIRPTVGAVSSKSPRRRRGVYRSLVWERAK